MYVVEGEVGRVGGVGGAVWYAGGRRWGGVGK